MFETVRSLANVEMFFFQNNAQSQTSYPTKRMGIVVMMTTTVLSMMTVKRVAQLEVTRQVVENYCPNGSVQMTVGQSDFARLIHFVHECHSLPLEQKGTHSGDQID